MSGRLPSGTGSRWSHQDLDRPQRFPVCVPESEDEVEEIEERVPSPDAAAEDSTPFYDQAAW